MAPKLGILSPHDGYLDDLLISAFDLTAPEVPTGPQQRPPEDTAPRPGLAAWLMSEDDLDDTFLRLVLLDGRAESSRDVQGRQYRAFKTWCMNRCSIELKAPHPHMPTTPDVIIEYAEARAAAGIRISTIRSNLGAIVAEHKVNQLPSPRTTRVTQALRTLAKELESHLHEKQARPLRELEVVQIMATCYTRREPFHGGRETWSYARRRGDQDCAIILLMRDCLLRINEAANACWGHLATKPDGSGRLYLPFSKTDQMGRGVWLYVSKRTMAYLEKIRPADAKPDGTIFRLHPASIAHRIAQACWFAGLGRGFTGHSCRVGMALDLLEAGHVPAGIMADGRWTSSSTVAKYVRQQEPERGAVSDYFKKYRTRFLMVSLHASSDSGGLSWLPMVSRHPSTGITTVAQVMTRRVTRGSRTPATRTR